MNTMGRLVITIGLTLFWGCAAGPVRDASPIKPAGLPNGTGIALAGGGTKAASYAMGVLAAVADQKEGLGEIDAISTVSGGGYSAFFLYSKLLERERDPSRHKPEVQDFFNDCIPDTYEPVLPRGFPGMCKSSDLEKFRFQQYVRCRQDVLENDCRQQFQRHDGVEYASAITNTVFLLGASGAMTAPSLVANTVFDWPVNMSPSRFAYREGIGTAYGLYPLSKAALAPTGNIASTCAEGAFLNCETSLREETDPGVARLDRSHLTFDNLSSLLSKSRRNGTKIPIWYINATASKSRSLFGWAKKGERDFTRYTLQMSPYGARSGMYGSVENYREELDLLDGVTAAAAFFDANETSLAQPWRMTVAGLQHLFTFDWGTDIKNPNVNRSWRLFHAHLPFPLYYVDGAARWVGGVKDNQHSAYIRLMDGGNNDNLGAFTLYAAGMKHIIISDHAGDKKRRTGDDGVSTYFAKMVDVCRLRNEITLRSGGKRKLILPGLEDFDRHCLEFIDESECADGPCQSLPGVYGPKLPDGGYPILEWKHQVVLGCITDIDNQTATCHEGKDVRVYLLKPALNLDNFRSRYLESAGQGRFRVKAAACDQPGLCEVAAYIADWYNHAPQQTQLHDFPQDGTVARTYASTGKIYGAYRELARWQMHDALQKEKLPSAEFNRQMQGQSQTPDRIRRRIFILPEAEQTAWGR